MTGLLRHRLGGFEWIERIRSSGLCESDPVAADSFDSGCVGIAGFATAGLTGRRAWGRGLGVSLSMRDIPQLGAHARAALGGTARHMLEAQGGVPGDEAGDGRDGGGL